MYFKSALIGYSGFVGSNLSLENHFDLRYNSENINEIEDKEIEFVICAGISALKWRANQHPKDDYAKISQLKRHLSKVKVKRFVLISTVDIYDLPLSVNEDDKPNELKQDAYGYNRYQFEKWVMQNENFKNYHIIRLPALFGQGLKKNLIFDLINPLATLINTSTWDQLSSKCNIEDIDFILKYYIKMDLGYKLKESLPRAVQDQLIRIFKTKGFSSLNFTDSRSIFQFYHLKNLFNDINQAISNNWPIYNLSSEPISADELVEYVQGSKFNNHTQKGPIQYNMYSKYADNHQYIYSKATLLEEIKQYIIGCT